MADLVRNNYRLSQAIQKLPATSAVKLAWQKKLDEWDLVSWEDALLWQFFYGTDLNAEFCLELGQDYLAAMRGSDGSMPLVPGEIEKLVLADDLLGSPEFQKRLLRTLYYSLNMAVEPSVLLTLQKLREFWFGSPTSSQLPAELKLFYQIYFVVAAMHHFDLLPDGTKNLIFGGNMVVLAFELGFNVEEAVRRDTDKYTHYDIRRNLCLDLAAFLDKNEARLFNDKVSEDEVDKILPVKELINLFRNYCQRDFTGAMLMGFLEDENNAHYFAGGRKELARSILELYTHLVNGFLIIPDGDFQGLENQLEEMEERKERLARVVVTTPKTALETASPSPVLTTVVAKPSAGIPSKPTLADFKKFCSRRFVIFQDGQFANPVAVVDKLSQWAEQYSDPEMNTWLYFDEGDGKFHWKD